MKPLDFGGAALIWGLDRNPFEKENFYPREIAAVLFPCLDYGRNDKGSAVAELMPLY